MTVNHLLDQSSQCVYTYDVTTSLVNQAPAYAHELKTLSRPELERLAAQPKPTEHPLLGRWDGYAIHEVVWRPATDGEESSLDVVLRLDDHLRRYRFLGLSRLQLRLGGGEPEVCSDTRMMDLTPLGESERGVEIWSGTFGDPISLVAKTVVELSPGDPRSDSDPS